MRHTYFWLLQLVTGVLIAVLLGVHMVLMHLEAILAKFGISLPQEPTSWSSMTQRAADGSWLAFYLLLLAFVLYHGLNGVRSLMLELFCSRRGQLMVNWLTIVAGIITFGLGTYVPVILFRS